MKIQRSVLMTQRRLNNLSIVLVKVYNTELLVGGRGQTISRFTIVSLSWNILVLLYEAFME